MCAKTQPQKRRPLRLGFFCTLKRFSIDFLQALCYIFSSKQYGKLCTMQELLTEYGFRQLRRWRHGKESSSVRKTGGMSCCGSETRRKTAAKRRTTLPPAALRWHGGAAIRATRFPCASRSAQRANRAAPTARAAGCLQALTTLRPSRRTSPPSGTPRSTGS